MKTFYILLLNCVIGNFIFGQTTFNKSYGGVADDMAYSVQQTNDNGYITVGFTASFPTGEGRVYLIKTNVDGNIEWTKVYGDSTHGCIGYCVRQTLDEGYIITGIINNDVLLIKTDSIGNLTWIRSFANADNAGGYSVQQTLDGGYVISGYTNSWGVGGSNSYLIKTDSSGNLQWAKTYGGSDLDYSLSVCQTSDGGYMMAGTTSSFGAGNTDAYIIKTDMYGDTVWTKTFGNAGNDYCRSAQQTMDGGYVIAGLSYKVDLSKEMFLIKTDNDGNTVWAKTYYNETHYFDPHFVQQTSDNGYIITGDAPGDTSPLNLFLIKADSNGTSEWSTLYFPEAMGREVQQTSDGGYIVVGCDFHSLAGVSPVDLFLIKTDSSGNSCNSTSITIADSIFNFSTSSPLTFISPGGTESSPIVLTGSGGDETLVCSTIGIKEQEQNMDVVVAPNPTTGNVYFSGLKNENKIEIYDITGRLIFQTITKNNSYNVNLNENDKGIYIYRIIEQNKNVQQGKIVLQ